VVPNFIPKEHGSPTLIKGVRTNAESALSCGSVWHTGRFDISISLWESNIAIENKDVYIIGK